MVANDESGKSSKRLRLYDSSVLTPRAMCSAAAVAAVLAEAWRTGGTGGIKASTIRFVHRYADHTTVY